MAFKIGYPKTIIPATTVMLLTASILSGSCTTEEPEIDQTPQQSETTKAWSADGIITEGEYSATAQYGNYRISWRSEDQFAYIGIKAKTTGFVSVGFQPGSKMKDADMIYGYVEAAAVSIFDMYSTGDFGPHPQDTELGGTRDIDDYGGSEEDGFTTIEFKRAFDTGDEYDIMLSHGKIDIIWAYGSSDAIDRKHSNRGYGEINLQP